MRSLLVYPCSWLLLYLLGLIFLRNQRHTHFYNFDSKGNEKKSAKRLGEAVQFFDEFFDGSTYNAAGPAATPQRSPLFCIAITTSKRPERYFLQTVHSLLTSMSKRERASSRVIVVTTQFRSTTVTVTSDDTSDAARREDLQRVKPHVDEVFQHIVMHDESKKKKRHHDNDHWLRDETSTYAAALERCQLTGSMWTLVLEDDAIARVGFLDDVRGFISLLQERNSLENFGTVKLFQTEYYFGWEKSDGWLLLVVGACVGGMFAALVECVKRCGGEMDVTCATGGERAATGKRKKSDDQVVPTTLCEVSAVVVQDFLRGKRMRGNGGGGMAWLHGIMLGCTVVLCLLLVGKQNVVRPYPVTKGLYLFESSETVDSNTVATLFPTSIAREISTMLSSSLGSGGGGGGGDAAAPVDVALSNWCLEKGRTRWYVVPSLFQHIGVWSSSPRKRRGTRNSLRRGESPVFKQSDTFG